MKTVRRFIAGARCPSCEAVDTLALSERDGQRVCTCVDCGFTDAQDRAAGNASDPQNRGLGEAVAQAQSVRIIDPRQH
jgi:uncharacterized metal-binding protein (TIGR02443 family)